MQIFYFHFERTCIINPSLFLVGYFISFVTPIGGHETKTSEAQQASNASDDLSFAKAKMKKTLFGESSKVKIIVNQKDQKGLLHSCQRKKNNINIFQDLWEIYSVDIFECCLSSYICRKTKTADETRNSALYQKP